MVGSRRLTCPSFHTSEAQRIVFRPENVSCFARTDAVSPTNSQFVAKQ